LGVAASVFAQGKDSLWQIQRLHIALACVKQAVGEEHNSGRHLEWQFDNQRFCTPVYTYRARTFVQNT
jgi:hypothetical protein